MSNLPSRYCDFVAGNVNTGECQDIHIGDRTYVSWNDEAIQASIQAIRARYEEEKKGD